VPQLQHHTDEPESLINALERTGGHLIVFESEYWGKECFGPDSWVKAVFTDINTETEDAYLLDNAFPASVVVSATQAKERAVGQLMALRNDGDPDHDHLDKRYWASELQSAKDKLNSLRARKLDGGELDSGWVPKSKVVFEAQRDGPKDYVIFGEDAKHRGIKDDAECAIEGTTLVTTRHRRYEKLAIDIPYREDLNPKEDIEELTWEDHHFTAKFVNDNFECWVSDKKPRDVAQTLAQYYDGVAVHETVLNQYDG
jgi:hypothetical protein